MSKEAALKNVLVIRSWPKMIFMWPTALASLLACIAAQFLSEGWNETFGVVFLLTFALNLAVLTFDFPRSTSLTIFVTVITVVLGIVLLNQQFGIIGPIQKWFSSLELHASRDFYFSIFLSMVMLYLGMAIVTRFDYWELTNNELIHHSGLLGDVERFSTAGLKLNTEINDVFEYILAGAGRIIINIPGNPRPFVLDNVLRINKILDESKVLLSKRVVEVSGGLGDNDGNEQASRAEYE